MPTALRSGEAVTATALDPALDAPLAGVRIPARTTRSDLRAIKIVWQRELLRFRGDPMRIITSLFQPLLFLFVLGTGLSRISSAGTHGVNLRTLVYPGVLAMAVMFTAMFFISGALFPVAGLPAWLAVLNRLDPLTYAVDPMRRAVFAQLDVSPAARQALDPGVTWWGWRVPTLLEAAVVAALGALMLTIAIAQFSRTE
jgi:ABC-type polysaccharide/polyol phosphate export permease